MANFRVYPGLFVRVDRDYDNLGHSGVLKAGQVAQTMCLRFGGVAFVGVPGLFPLKRLSLTPLYTTEEIVNAQKESS